MGNCITFLAPASVTSHHQVHVEVLQLQGVRGAMVPYLRRIPLEKSGIESVL